jgi:tape measure domain-containing protein
MAGRPIDEKIVAMKMDNSDFKQKAVETTGLFGKLRDALNRVPGISLGKTTQELGNIQQAAGSTNLNSLANSVDNVANRFTNLGVMATTALVNITNRAVNAGLELARSLTVAPIMDGFNEYELKMNSIQTMLSNTEWEHTTLKDVKGVLGELNNYADKTIYDFGQMTSSIGKWTAAGVGLKDSATAIKGMGNLAAVSGASVDQLNTAMYQMSQGMAAGKFGAIDWISMTNAGMGGKKTQDALMATAKAMGKNIDMSKGFKGSLEQGWLTSKVFLKTMQQFGKDKSMTEAATSVRTFTGMIAALKEGVGSGWAETWELVFGDFEVATKRWTAVSTVVGKLFQKQTDARNKFVKGLADAGVFNTIFDGVTNGLNSVLLILNAIGKGFDLAFPPAKLKNIKSLSQGFRAFFGMLTPSRETFQNIVKISQAFFAVIKAGALVIAWFAKSLYNMIPPELGSNILNLLKHVAGIVIAFATSKTTLNVIKTIFNTLSLVVRTVANEFMELGKSLLGMIPSGLANSIGGFFKRIADAFIGFATSQSTINAITSAIKGLFSIIKTVIGVVILLGQALVYLVPPALGEVIVNLVENFFRFLTNLTKLVPSFDNASGSGEGLTSTLSRLDGTFSGLGGVLSEISKGFSNLGDAISQAWDILSKGDFNKGPWAKDSLIVNWLYTIRDACISIGDYLQSLNISLTPIVNGFKGFFGAIADGFNWIKDKIFSIGDTIKNALPDGNKMFAGGFLASMIAIVGLAVKMAWDIHKVFTGWGKIGEGITDVLDGVSGSLEGFSRVAKANAIATTVLAVAIAVGLLAIALKLVSTINPEKVGASLTSMVTIMSALIGGMAIMTKYDIKGTGMKSALIMMGMSFAVMLMAGALKKISTMNVAEIGKGILGLVGIMASLSGAFVLMSKFGGAKVGATALQMIGIAISLHLLISVIKKLATIKPEDLKQGVKWLGAILLELGIFFALAGKTKFGFGATLGMLAVGKAVMNIIDAIKEMSNMKPKDLKSGLKIIAEILATIAIFAAITGYTGLVASGVGLLLISVALTALLVPLSILGKMNPETLAKGLGSIAIALFAIAGASMLMTGMMAAGAGIILIAIGLTLLLVPISVFAAMSWGALLKGITGFALAILVIGGVAALLGLAAAPMLAFGAAVAVIGLAMMLGGVGMSLFSTGLVALAAMSSAAITTIIATLATLIAGFASLIPIAAEFVVKLIIGIINAIAKHLPELIDSAANLVASFIDGLANAIEKYGPKILVGVMRIIAQILILIIKAGAIAVRALFSWIPGVEKATKKIGETAEKTIKDAFDAEGIGEEKGQDFATGLGSKTGEAETAGKTLSGAGKTGTDSPDFKFPGMEKGQEFVLGLSGQSGDAQTAGTKVANAGKTGASNPNFKIPGVEQGSEFVLGLGSKTGDAQTAGEKVANAGKTGAGSVSLHQTGINFAAGFASGIVDQTPNVQTASEVMAQAAKNRAERYLKVQSPSRVMMKVGGYFGEGFALGIIDKAKRVGDNAKNLAMTAKDSLNQFLDGFELPGNDNELHFKAVIDYDKLDTSKFGGLAPLRVSPNTSLTSSMIPTPTSTAPMTGGYGQNDSNKEIINKQEQQLGVMQKQIELLSGILNKDNSTYLDGKELYNSNKKIQNNQTTIRNFFKGVNRV